MRKCKGRYYKKGKYYDFEIGYFHQWDVTTRNLNLDPEISVRQLLNSQTEKLLCPLRMIFSF